MGLNAVDRQSLLPCSYEIKFKKRDSELEDILFHAVCLGDVRIENTLGNGLVRFD